MDARACTSYNSDPSRRWQSARRDLVRHAFRPRPILRRVGGVSLGHLANAARAFVNSKLAALGRSFLRSWQTAGKEEKAPSMSYQHGEELDLALVQDKLQPLLSRANLIITRRAQWANIMFRFQQETRYIIKDPRTPRRKTPVGLIREKSNFILRQESIVCFHFGSSTFLSGFSAAQETKNPSSARVIYIVDSFRNRTRFSYCRGTEGILGEMQLEPCGRVYIVG